jgi:hypothetical protein
VLSGDDFGRRPDDHPRRDAIHGVRVPGSPDAEDASFLDADVGFNDAPVVDDDGVCYDEIEGCVRRGRLCHAIADRLSAAERRLIAEHVEVSFDQGVQTRIGKADAVAGGWAVEVGVAFAGDAVTHG